MKVSWILRSLIFLLISKNAFAWSVMPVGVLNQGSAAFGISNGYTTGSAYSSYGAGVLFGFRMAPRVFMETGLLYVTRGFTMEFTSGSTNTYSFVSGQVPMAIRFYVLKSIYLGVGGYFSHAVNGVNYTSSTGSSGTMTFSQAACGADDYGGLFALGMKLSLFSFFSFVIDGRYLHGLQNISTVQGATTYFRDLQVLGGVRFGI